jgi:hypothetical protein
MISILGVDDTARPIQIIPKSVKTIKKQTITFAEIVEDDFSMKNLEEAKNKKVEFHWRNIMPIPHILTKAYLSLENFDPQSVAQAFYAALKEFDLKAKNPTVNPNLIDEENFNNPDEAKTTGEKEDSSSTEKENEEGDNSNSNSCYSMFIHVLQFCHLCFLKKVAPVMYSVISTPEVNCWFESISMVALRSRHPRIKRHSVETSLEFSSDDSISSPNRKFRERTKYFLTPCSNYMFQWINCHVKNPIKNQASLALKNTERI